MSKRKKEKKKKKKVKGMREERIESAEEKEMRVEHVATTGTSEDIEVWWDKFEELELDGKLVLFYNTFASEEKEEFWEGLELFDAVEKVFNDLALKGRVEEGIKLLEKLKEQRYAQYMADYPYYDYNLLHYYAPLDERERIKEIIEHFEEDPVKGIDHISVALDIFRLYGMAEEACQVSRGGYQKLKGSEEIMPWGVAELNQRAVFCVIREYITSPDYGKKEVEGEFYEKLKALDFWDEDSEDDERLQKTVKTLRGEIRRDWTREDFMISNADYEDNVYLFFVEFIRYLNIDKSFEWVTGDLFFELVLEYFAEVPERRAGFYFCFSKEYLDKYLVSFFDFLSLNDAKGMAVLKALEYFSSFLYLKGIFTDEELKEVGSAIEEFSVPLRRAYEKMSWKYRFLDRWE
jgi:hypothetical protein